jgi:hypothetical protein
MATAQYIKNRIHDRETLLKSKLKNYARTRFEKTNSDSALEGHSLAKHQIESHLILNGGWVGGFKLRNKPELENLVLFVYLHPANLEVI